MNVEFFKSKFEAKSVEELEQIAFDNKNYVIDARFAAVTILKNRNTNSSIIKIVENEFQASEEENQTKSAKVLNELRAIKTNKGFKLDKWRELKVTKLNNQLFQISLELYRYSDLLPVIFCYINSENKCHYYPFFNIRGILVFSAIVLFFPLLFYFQNSFNSEFIIELLIFIPIFVMAFQILFLPIYYSFILNTFKEKMLIENAS